MARPTFHKLRVARVDRLTGDAVAITFEIPDDLAGHYSFTAGQYLTLRQNIKDSKGIGGTEGIEERRSYSICAPVGSPPRIGVRRVDGGLFSAELVDTLKPGDTLEVLPPLGKFTPTLDKPGHHCLIAAGSGITPVLSIIGTVLAADADSKVTLLYGNRRTDTVMFAEELADLKDVYRSRLQLVHVLSREPRDVDLFTGRLDAERLAALLATVVPTEDIDHWWLCGPLGMVEAAQTVLTSRDVPDERIHRELFYVDEPPPAPKRADDAGIEGPSAEVTVILDGKRTTLTLPADTPILDAAQRVRADLPFACKGGVCGTCRAKVVAGEVSMRRNYALEPHELAEGFVLTCQGLPVTDQVTVDYDT